MIYVVASYTALVSATRKHMGTEGGPMLSAKNIAIRDFADDEIVDPVFLDSFIFRFREGITDNLIGHLASNVIQLMGFGAKLQSGRCGWKHCPNEYFLKVE